MPIPVVAGVMLGAGSVLAGSHTVRKAYETQEFWKNYKKNTGLSPRYPFRAGVYDFYRDIGHMSLGIGALYGRQNITYGVYKKPARPRYNYRRYRR